MKPKRPSTVRRRLAGILLLAAAIYAIGNLSGGAFSEALGDASVDTATGLHDPSDEVCLISWLTFVSEPGTLALVCLGGGMFTILRRRRGAREAGRAAICLLGISLALPGASHAAVTAAERAAYDRAVQSIVDAVNAYRASEGLPVLVPLRELGWGARTRAEDRMFRPGADDPSATDRARSVGFTGLGVGGITAEASGNVFTYRNFSATEFIDWAAEDATWRGYLTDTRATSIGVGIAFEMSIHGDSYGGTARGYYYVLIGRDGTGPAPYGTPGLENSGRGLPDSWPEVDYLLSSTGGDSISGFYDEEGYVSPKAQEKFNKALKKLTKKVQRIPGKAGQPLQFKLPKEVFKVAAKLKKSGKLPPGVRFDDKKGLLKGAPAVAGTYNAKIKVWRPEMVPGRRTESIRLRFSIGAE